MTEVCGVLRLYKVGQVSLCSTGFLDPVAYLPLFPSTFYLNIIMPWFNENHEYAQAHSEVLTSPHKAQLSHELLAGAASYEAAKAYERHV
ncbi:hypothetical protein BJV78DRAFT_1330339 [Lactifluus subvellereus]|nr:hypothetical protein BJV78DRAFT_1330339 [Lactifluus subvellereus]